MRATPTGERVSLRNVETTAWSAGYVQDMWDILKWQNDTLSIAWWALVSFALLVIIVAGSRAAK